MKKKYRIKLVPAQCYDRSDSLCENLGYMVQVRSWWGVWVDLKFFLDPDDPGFARREAEELLDHLNEK